jgi:hypothetical protein
MTDASKRKRRAERAMPAPAASGSAATTAQPERPDPAPVPIDAASLDEALVKALEEDFRLNGRKAIEAMRAEKPTDYVKIVASLRAKDADDAGDSLREMSDAELDRHIAQLARHAGYDIRPCRDVHVADEDTTSAQPDGGR